MFLKCFSDCLIKKKCHILNTEVSSLFYAIMIEFFVGIFAKYLIEFTVWKIDQNFYWWEPENTKQIAGDLLSLQ